MKHTASSIACRASFVQIASIAAGTAARSGDAWCALSVPQRAYMTSSGGTPSHPPQHSASKNNVDPSELFANTFGSSFASAAAAPPYATVEALFADQFGSTPHTVPQKIGAGQHGDFSRNASPFHTPHAAAAAYSGNAPTSRTSFHRSNTTTTFNAAASVRMPVTFGEEQSGGVRRPWAGLWALLAGGHYAGIPAQSHTTSAYPQPYNHDSHYQQHQQQNRQLNRTAAQTQVSGPAPPRFSLSATHAPQAGRNVSANTTTTATTAASSPAPAPPAVQRYWHSYRLWQSVHQQVQQEGSVLEGIRAQMRSMKAAQRAIFQAQLRNTTRWTLCVVMPLLTLLWVSIFFDTVLYRAEVMRLQFVKYDTALQEYEEATAKDRMSKVWKGQKNVKANKKNDIKID